MHHEVPDILRVIPRGLGVHPTGDRRKWTLSGALIYQEARLSIHEFGMEM